MTKAVGGVSGMGKQGERGEERSGGDTERQQERWRVKGPRGREGKGERMLILKVIFLGPSAARSAAGIALPLSAVLFIFNIN